MSESRGGFKSNFGIVAAVGGSAVGLANIWRFPYLVGENGGGAFIFVYVVVCLLFSLPIMLAEMSIGREGGSDVVNSIRRVSQSKTMGRIGYMFILTPFVIMSFYCVVGGWAMRFLKEALFDGFSGLDMGQMTDNFALYTNSFEPVVWSVLFVAITAAVVMLGVDKGIEKYSKAMMPLILIILVGMVVYSTTMSGFTQSVRFLFTPDFSKIDFNVIMQAVGQSFLSLSLGMGVMVTYSSYVKKDVNLLKVASLVTLADFSVAMLSGLAVFPIVFTLGGNLTSGADLVFITLPMVFGEMPFGYFVSVIFFLLLVFAAITSSVSQLEIIIAYIRDDMKVKRSKAVVGISLLIMIAVVLCTLSLMDNSKLKVAGYSLFDFADGLSSSLLLPLGGLMSVILAGWFMSNNTFHNQMTSNGKVRFKFYPLLRFVIRYVAPIFITVLLFRLLIGV